MSIHYWINFSSYIELPLQSDGKFLVAIGKQAQDYHHLRHIHTISLNEIAPFSRKATTINTSINTPNDHILQATSGTWYEASQITRCPIGMTKQDDIMCLNSSQYTFNESGCSHTFGSNFIRWK
jgi:hypothetical protein